MNLLYKSAYEVNARYKLDCKYDSMYAYDKEKVGGNCTSAILINAGRSYRTSNDVNTCNVSDY